MNITKAEEVYELVNKLNALQITHDKLNNIIEKHDEITINVESYNTELDYRTTYSIPLLGADMLKTMVKTIEGEIWEMHQKISAI